MGSASRGTDAQIFLRYRLKGFFSGLPLGEPLPGIFDVSFIDKFPFIQSPFRGSQIPEIKELLGAFPPGPPPGLCPGTFSDLTTFTHDSVTLHSSLKNAE